jgi:hypothetical protein
LDAIKSQLCRIFLRHVGVIGTDATHAEEALWSSPVWITWSR